MVLWYAETPDDSYYWTLMPLFADQYIPEVSENVLHSPLLAKSFENLPPALVQVAGKGLNISRTFDSNTR